MKKCYSYLYVFIRGPAGIIGILFWTKVCMTTQNKIHVLIIFVSHWRFYSAQHNVHKLDYESSDIHLIV